jgi:predicted acylesterase/phospholipase RssA
LRASSIEDETTVEGQGKSKITKTSDNNLPKADAGLDQTVSEGSTVTLNGHGFTTDEGKVSYSWSRISHRNYDITIINADSPNPAFKAPYIMDDSRNRDIEPSITLKFQLVVSDNKGTSSNPSEVNIKVKRVQRAIIFQAGVALGAYEAGVYHALVKTLSKEHRERGLENIRPLFDIVAGASIGAMNAAVVVSNAIKSKNWEHSADELGRFWKYQKYPSLTVADFLDMNPIYHFWWDIMHITNKTSKSSANTLTESILNINPYFKNWYDLLMGYLSLDPDFWKDYFIDGWYIPATGEAARRYYSAWQCKHGGAPHVASGILPLPWSAFGKFFDFSDQSNFALPRNYLPRPDNKHFFGYSLKKTLESFVHFPIKTQTPDPRFLLVTVDVETGDAVTFDSYEKKTQENNLGKYYSEYGDEQSKHTIIYERGVEIQHALASGTFPNFFDYPKFNVKDSQTNLENERHNFWDGSLRSTTPLREVIQAHRDYWHEPDSDKDDVPDLEVYIADLWPSLLKEEPTSFDLDFVENRKWNILFSDKTDYDEQVAKVVGDYNDLVNELKNLAERRGIKDEIKDILKQYARSEKRNGRARTYKDLLGGRFRLTKVVSIDRKDDGNEVHDKIFDYSHTTIENLMKDGYCDALTKLGIQAIKDAIMEIKRKIGNKGSNNIWELERHLQQLERRIGVGNSNDSRILNQIEDFAHKAESMHHEVDYNGSIKEEKAFLVNAAKQLKEIIIETINLNELPGNP